MEQIVTEKQKAEVRKYITKWRSKLFLHQWDFAVEYHNDEQNKNIKITMKPEYKDALLEINVDSYFLLEKDKAKREEIIVHELCHAILQPMVHVACEAAMGRQVSQQEIDYYKESVTQHFARSIYYLNNI